MSTGHTDPELILPESELAGIWDADRTGGPALPPPLPRPGTATRRRDSLLDFEQIGSVAQLSFESDTDEPSEVSQPTGRARAASRSWLLAAGLAVGLFVGLSAVALFSFARQPPRPQPVLPTAVEATPVDLGDALAEADTAVNDAPKPELTDGVKAKARPPTSKKSKRSARR